MFDATSNWVDDQIAQAAPSREPVEVAPPSLPHAAMLTPAQDQAMRELRASRPPPPVPYASRPSAASSRAMAPLFRGAIPAPRMQATFEHPVTQIIPAVLRPMPQSDEIIVRGEPPVRPAPPRPVPAASFDPHVSAMMERLNIAPTPAEAPPEMQAMIRRQLQPPPSVTFTARTGKTNKTAQPLKSFFVRPGYGTRGREIEIESNFFAVRPFSTATGQPGRGKMIFHYDVDINPLVKTLNQKKPKGLLRAVWEQLCLEGEAKEVWGPSFATCVFDGRRNAFTPIPFPIAADETQAFTIAVASDGVVTRPDPQGRSSSDDENRRWKVVIKLVAQVDLEILMEYCRPAGTDNPKTIESFNEEHTLTGIMMTNVLMRDLPSKKYAQVGATGNRFFTMDGASPIPQGGMVCRGFTQSMRHSSSGMPLLNIDVAFSAFLATGSALDVVAKILARRQPRQIGGGPGGPVASERMSQPGGYLGGLDRLGELGALDERDVAIIKHKLKGAKFTVTHRPSTRLHTVQTVTSLSAFQIYFNLNGENGQEDRKISITEYYQEFYRVTVTKPRLPCIQYGKKAFIPLEFVKLEQWNSLPPPKLTAEQTAEMIKVAAVPPPRRAQAVKAWRQELAHESQKKIAAWGLEVNMNMIKVKARLLPAPAVSYASTQTTPRDGSWALRGHRFFRPAQVPLKAWAVVSFDKFFDIRSSQRYVHYLVRQFREHGIPVENEQPPCSEPTDPREIKNQIGAMQWAALEAYRAGGRTVPPQLILVVLPGRDAWLYESIKRISFKELFKPVPTQCMQATKINTDRGLLAYTQNLIMKIQSKLGGITHQVPLSELPGMIRGETMLLGADIGHPPIKPGYDTAPTVACSIATFDADCSRFSAQIRLQEGRDEIVVEFSDMVENHIKAFHRHNNALPSRILIFRDGVSEGQYSAALMQEHNAVVQACARLQADYRPQILICICAKRHNTRFFGNDGDIDRSGNLPPGLVVDRTVTHPYAYDFFLQAHGARVGTARPTHYICLLDEIGLTPDQLQQTVHSLSYGFARCTKSVSLVPVCYIADLVCQKARIIMHDTERGTTVAPSESSFGAGKKDKSASGRGPNGLSRNEVMKLQDLLSKNEAMEDVMWWM